MHVRDRKSRAAYAYYVTPSSLRRVILRQLSLGVAYFSSLAPPSSALNWARALRTEEGGGLGTTILFSTRARDVRNWNWRRAGKNTYGDIYIHR